MSHLVRRAANETDRAVIFVTYIWSQGVKTMRASCSLCFLYNHNSSNGSDAEAQPSVYTPALEHITAEITLARLA